jgi:hypothetical protein
MSEDCFNKLYARGNSEEVAKLFDFLDGLSDIGKHFVELEESLEDIEADLDLPCASQCPYSYTFEVDVETKSISWEARGYPSLLAVYKLSQDFPDINFFLDFDNTEDELVGKIAIRNGNITENHFVYFDDGAIDLLLGNYRDEIMSLKVGEKIEVGVGMIDVECTGEEDDDEEIRKEFDVIFQCDESPKIVVHVPKHDQDLELSLDTFMDGDYSIDYFDYSDDDGNDDATDSAYHREMCAHADRTPDWWEEGLNS